MKLKDESKKAQQQYRFGSSNRARGFGRETNPNSGDLQAKHWWLAGWHDKDMEFSA